MKTILNYTPHPLNLFVGEQEFVIPSSGVARVEEVQEVLGLHEFQINGQTANVPVISKTFKKEVIGLPPEKLDLDGNEISNMLYIVSALVKSASNRQDVVGIGEFKRNEKGMIIGAFSLDADRYQLDEFVPFQIPNGFIKIEVSFEEKDLDSTDFYYVDEKKASIFPRNLYVSRNETESDVLISALKELEFQDGEVFYENYHNKLEDIFHLS